ncbi:MAG: AAA family ATPase, partial [Chloroflexi bacterium]|nr:AAA family ATPase [Chloroflexota bacterium]
MEFVAPYFARGVLTELVGALKLAGKTTFLLHMAKAITTGSTFLGAPTVKGPVVFLTEQFTATLRDALEGAGLLGSDDLHILTWAAAAGASWPDVVSGAFRKCEELGAVMVLFDTLPHWMGLVGDRENNSGDAMQAMRPLLEGVAEHPTVAVGFTRHEKAAGGVVTKAGRGSTAFSAQVDICLLLKRVEGSQEGAAGRRRQLECEGRFRALTRSTAIELTDTGYVTLGSGHNVAVHDARALILDLLSARESAAIPLEAKGDTLSVMNHGSAQGKLTRTVAQDALRALVAEGYAGQTGKGAKGDPHRYWRIDSAAPIEVSCGV